MEERYGLGYFERSLERNLAGRHRGDKWFLHHYWLRRLRRLVRSDARVLEVGCGLGFFTSRVAREYAIVGLDVSRAALSFLRDRWGLRSLVCADAHRLPFRDDTFDVVVAFDVVEHLTRPEAFLREGARVLRHGGIVILTTPNPASLGARWKGGEVTREHGRRWFGYRDHTHVSIRPIESWRDAFADANLGILEEGTDFLWDAPYFARVPAILQKVFFTGTQWLGGLLVGFLPWRHGENYVAVLRRSS